MARENKKNAGAPLKYGEKVDNGYQSAKVAEKEVMSAVKEVLKKYETRYVIENQFGLYLNQHAGKDCSFYIRCRHGYNIQNGGHGNTPYITPTDWIQNKSKSNKIMISAIMMDEDMQVLGS